MKVAVIDIGSNTFNLMIAQVGNHSFKVISATEVPVRLGKDGFKDGRIAQDAMQRAISVLVSFKEEINKNDIQNVRCIGTNMVRSAINKHEFLDLIREHTSFEVEIISGDREAELILEGVSASGTLSNSNVLIVDIGGGSTELIIANNKKVFWKRSYELGAVRLLEHFKPSDPPTETEINDLCSYLNRQWNNLLPQIEIYKPKILIGSSGVFESFVDILLATKNEHRSAIVNEIDINEYTILHHRLLSMNNTERSKIVGLVDFRVDTIIIASIITSELLKLTEVSQMRQTDYALKEGVIWEIVHSVTKKS